MNLKDYSEKEIMDFYDSLSLILLVDKIRVNKGDNLPRQLPFDYVEKLSLQIPDSLRMLLGKVIRVLLDKGGVDRQEAEKVAGYVENGEWREKGGMFEAVIESIIEAREDARKEGWEEGREEGIAKGLEQGLEQGREQGWEQGRKEGIAKGLEQGLEQGIEITARNALAEGATLEFVQKITGLDIETLRSIQGGE